VEEVVEKRARRAVTHDRARLADQKDEVHRCGGWWKGAASAAAGVVAAATLNVTAAHADWDALCGAEGSGNHATLMCVGMEFGTTARGIVLSR
jgi:hypothetical protein